MSDVEKLLHHVRDALGFGTPADAADNLQGALYDIEHDNYVVDEVCQQTLRRVLKQLHDARAILARRQ